MKERNIYTGRILLLLSFLLITRTSPAQEYSTLADISPRSGAFRSLPQNSFGKVWKNSWMAIDIHKSELHLLFNDTAGIYYSFSPDNGMNWHTSLLHPSAAKSSSGSLAAQNAVIRTDSRGTVHIFLVSTPLRYSPSVVWHYSRIRGGEKWQSEKIDENETGPLLGESMDLDIDCNNHIHLVYNVGKFFTRYAYWNGNDWMFSDIAFGTRPLGCAVTAGFENKVHVAIGSSDGELGIATQSKGEKDWVYDRLPGTGYWQCDMTLAPDGGLVVSYENTGRTQLKIATKRPGSEWDLFHHSLPDSSSLSSPYGHPSRLRTDISGRIHTNYSVRDSSGEFSLIYMYSNNAGYQWQKYHVTADVASNTGYLPGLSWNDRFVFQAYTDSSGTPKILRLAHGMDLSKYERCLYENRNKNPVVVETVPDTIKEKKNTSVHPGKKEKRQIEKQGAFVTQDRYVKVLLRDYEDIDGDTISVFYNDKLILSNYGLTARTKMLEVEVEPGSAESLVIYAIHEGMRPPCTVSVIIKDSKREQRFTVKSNLKTNGSISLRSN